ncbi:MAG: Stp1/IreP family PP2C-type Ser/Thr phosphatase [Gammaproteobacteria bacterium]|nr:MAG: Stp1/IreP family PP2C-type Ser/Thr phosphatase [Gammaproteobacteria bacterium]
MIDLSDVLEVVAITDVGRRRDHNEDSVGADSAYGLVLVADGMGGHSAGEVASGIAANVVYEQLKAILPEIDSGGEDEETGYAVESIKVKEAIELANSAINQTARNQPECGGMGTTIVVGLFYDNRMTIAHVGDSRMYRVRGKRMEQMTKDHSLIQELVDKGFYETVEEAEEAGNKNLITRALGVEERVDVDIHEEMVRPGDIYLLCSDGVTDMITDEQIHLTINQFRDNLKQAAEKLVTIANNNGGKDNISVVLARPTRDFAMRKHWYGRLFDWFN